MTRSGSVVRRNLNWRRSSGVDNPQWRPQTAALCKPHALEEEKNGKRSPRVAIPR